MAGSGSSAGTGELDVGALPSSVSGTVTSQSKASNDLRHDTVGNWIALHWQQSVAAAFTIVCLVIVGAWYVSKFDSSLSAIQEDVKDIKGKVDKLASDNARQNVRLDYVERTLPMGKGGEIASPKLQESRTEKK